jgi:hypothetical protein
MGRWRAYIRPFDESGSYVATFSEITNDVTNQISNLKESLDDTDLDIGIIRPSSFTIKLNNITGKYGEAGTAQSIFKHTRNNSIVRITWTLTDDFPECGFITAGGNASFLSDEMTVFEGLVNDDSAKQDIDDQFISLRVLGKDDTLKRVSVDVTAISNGNLASVVLFTILNQAPITDVLTVSQSNITLSNDQTIDDVTAFDGLTVKEAVDDLLRISNSILYIDTDTIFTSARTPTAAVQFSFYGQNSDIGIENISSIKNITSGYNRIFNFLKWQNTTVVRQNTSSVTLHGVKKKEIGSSSITTLSKRQAMLDDIVAEFADPKQELDITTRFDYGTEPLDLLDRVDIDYPTVITSSEDLPIVGKATVGDTETPLPGEQSSFVISQLTNYKITRKTINTKKDTVTYHLREI